MSQRLANQVRSVRGNGNDIETSLRQDVNHTLANQRLILPYDDSKGGVSGHRVLDPTPFAGPCTPVLEATPIRCGVYPCRAWCVPHSQSARVQRRCMNANHSPATIPLGPGRSTGARRTDPPLPPRRVPRSRWSTVEVTSENVGRLIASGGNQRGDVDEAARIGLTGSAPLRPAVRIRQS